jgi:AraC family transcriptional regulator of adaptative response/methylated-DNA-[protein]-cysteine methyltransferase
MKRTKFNSLAALPIATSLGKFTARYSGSGLAELDFPGRGAPVAPKQNEGGRIPAAVRRWHRATAAALQSALAGRKPKSLPPLDLGGTQFQQRVWQALRNISAGKTKSYGAIARAIGKPKAVRAVGGACGANPIPVLIPCHRVLAANGKLGGFSGGLGWKRKLLAREGIVFSATKW